MKHANPGVLILICVLAQCVAVRASAQPFVQYRIPSPEGKVLAFTIAPGVRSPIACLGESDTVMYAGIYQTLSRRILYYCSMQDDGRVADMSVLDTALLDSGFMTYMTEDRFSPALTQGRTGDVAVVWSKQKGYWDDIVYPEKYDLPMVRCAVIRNGIASRLFQMDSADHPTACFDGHGDLHLAYEQVRFSPFTMPYQAWPETTYYFVTSQLVYTVIHPDGTRDSLLSIPHGFRPQLLIDKAGNRHLFWLEADSSNSPTFVLKHVRNPSVAPDAPSVVATGVRARGQWNFNRTPPVYAAFVDEQGVAYAGWSDIEEYNNGKISVAWLPNGQQWAVTQISGLQLWHSSPSLTVTPSGRVHVAWRENTPSPGYWTVHVAQGPAGEALFSQTDTLRASSIYPGTPVFVTDSRDSVHMVFDDDRSGIGYCRSALLATDQPIHVAAPSSIAFGIRGLPDGATQQTSVALDTTDQLWVVALGDSGLTLVRVNRTVTPVGPALASQPLKTELSQGYPNPFNPSTKLRLTIAERQLTVVTVYDVLGREVAVLLNEVKEPGTYALEFNGSGLASGVYLCRLAVRPSNSVPGRDSRGGAAPAAQTRKVLLVR